MDFKRLLFNDSKHNLTLAIATVAASPFIYKWANFSVHIFNCMAQTAVFIYTAYKEPMEVKKTKEVLSSYEFTKQVKSVEDMVVGRSSYIAVNYATGQKFDVKFDIKHTKDDCFGDVFIFNDCDNDNKLECVFVEGDNTESNVVNVCDFTKHIANVNERSLILTDKTYYGIKQLVYPVFIGYACIFWIFIKQITNNKK